MKPFSPDSPEALIALLEGTLAPEAAQHLRERLLADPELRAEYDHLQAMDARIVPLDDADVFDGIDLTAGVLARAKAAGEAPTADAVLDAEWIVAALEDELSGEEAGLFQARLADDAFLRTELESLGAVHTALIQLGSAGERNLPSIDVTAGVMAQLRAQKMEGRIIPFPVQDRSETQLSRRQRPTVSLWGVSAAAACIFVAAGITLAIVLRANVQDNAVMVADNVPNTAQSNTTTPTPSVPVDDVFKPVSTPVTQLAELNSKAERETPETPVDSTPRRGPVTLEDALKARRADMLGDSSNLSRLAALASLTEEQAKEVLAAAGLSPEALLGAAQFLSDADAKMILSALVDKNPDDPYLRMALALRGEPADMLNQAAAWSELDPENALPHYVQAQAHFAQGNAVDGLAALAAANGLQSGNLYSSDAALQREQAYLASGMDRDTARVLAASTAGYFEGQTFSNMTNTLMAQGRTYEQNGNYEAAEEVYNAVREMGAQVDTAALYTQEREVALNAQTQAVLALQGLYELLQEPESQVILGELASNLIDSLGVLDSQMTNLNQAFNNDANNVVNLAGFILTNGNLGDLLSNLF
jgi:anti-sigma factor RsiW